MHKKTRYLVSSFFYEIITNYLLVIELLSIVFNFSIIFQSR